MNEIPITVRGVVDDRAVAQLRRCAEAGNAVAGVLCADGHVGYSQPIGGAIACPDPRGSAPHVGQRLLSPGYGRERHHGVDAWVVRKGCTPAFPGQEGFVGATMGEASVILRGREGVDTDELLASTVHGAGRLMSRTQAAGRIANRMECSDRNCSFWVPMGQLRDARERAGAQDTRFTLCPEHPGGKMVKRRGRVKDGSIDFAAVQAALATDGIELRGGAADEAPLAYRRLDEVLAAHEDAIEVLHRLVPIGVAMAAADTVDPWKD